MSLKKSGFNYVCAHDMREENPPHVRLLELWKSVEEQTDGELSVQVIPWGQAGASKVSLKKLLDNDIAFHPISGMPLSTVVPIAAMEGLPFAYRSEEEAFRVLDGSFGDMLREHIAKVGVVIFPKIWPQGFNQISSSTRPIRTVEDLDGFKLRIAQVPYKQELFSALGCDPQQIYYQAIHDKLKSGAASGQETPYLYTEMDGFADVQKYLSITNHRFAAFWFCANPVAWNALPLRVREVVERNLDKYVRLFREDMLRANEEARARLERRLEFNVADTASFVDRLKRNGFYDRCRKSFGEQAWSLFETQLGRSYPG